MNEDRLFVLTDAPNMITRLESVGHCEVLPNVYFYLTKMPNRFHRFMMKMLLGWKFVEYSKDTPSEKILLNG